MDITNPVAVQFNKDSIRTVAKNMAHLYYECQEILGVWNNVVGGMFPNTDDVIIEGTPHVAPMTGIDANNMINRITEYVSSIDSAKLGTILRACDHRVIQ
jgi:hypothetical protein